jgi:hypothetical protein
MPENFECKDNGLKFKGRSLQDLLHETILAIDNELPQVKNMEYRISLVETAYKLRDLLYNQLKEQNTHFIYKG